METKISARRTSNTPLVKVQVQHPLLSKSLACSESPNSSTPSQGLADPSAPPSPARPSSAQSPTPLFSKSNCKQRGLAVTKSKRQHTSTFFPSILELCQARHSFFSELIQNLDDLQPDPSTSNECQPPEEGGNNLNNFPSNLTTYRSSRAIDFKRVPTSRTRTDFLFFPFCSSLRPPRLAPSSNGRGAQPVCLPEGAGFERTKLGAGEASRVAGRGMSLSRSHCGGCSATYNTPSRTKVVCRRLCAHISHPPEGRLVQTGHSSLEEGPRSLEANEGASSEPLCVPL
ncbi:hypothetical protein TNCV_595321 [Trichonephila clavipes]|nr:hypothetical protein TNCV_595321 [Trichonephila clavipes]